MAGNEATSQTELWSSVVHRPCEEPEDAELPSTVDITAFSSGLSAEPPSTQNNDNSDFETDSDLDSSNSGSEVCQSSSQSDSSDTDSSTSSIESSSRSPSPEFSVTSSQNNGLRVTIATVRKSTSSPVTEKMGKETNDSTSTDSVCSTDSDTESEASVKAPPKETTKSAKDCVKKSAVKVRNKPVEKKTGSKKESTKTVRSKTKQKKTKKMTSLPASRCSPYSSSDSDDSDPDRSILASCSLQEIRQEDLAAILPDQLDCDAFGDFECNRTNKNSPQAGDMSGSDMELPQQAVNALIQRTTESSSESESHAPPNPSTLYANSLLQQFVQQTQLLNAPCPILQHNDDSVRSSSAHTTEILNNNEDVGRKKRGRPRKMNKIRMVKNIQKKTTSLEYCGDPNVSPDSGIQNSPDHVSSPEPMPSKSKTKPKQEDHKKTSKSKTSRNVLKNITKSKDMNKISVTANRFDRLLYANTDRVLYPPRRKVGRPPIIKKGPGRPSKQKPLPTEVQSPDKQTEKNKNNDINHKVETRLVLTTKSNKLDNSKIKYATLKNLKVMHSRRQHKKHKKYKIKIFKPLTNCVDLNNKVVFEIDKFVADFVKFCTISTNKPFKENVPEIKIAKKVSKKRKTTDERKKKKINSNAIVNNVTSVNEQRLPLKKRHYLFCDTKSMVKQVQTQESELKEEKSDLSHITVTTPKKRHRLEIINTEKENSLVQPVVIEYPKIKPKLSLENVVTELKLKRGLSNRIITENKKVEVIVNVEKLDPVVRMDNLVIIPEVKPLDQNKKKVRKRRSFNRTGFPSVKKKKKKISILEKSTEVKKEVTSVKNVCDRVPKHGEECDKFIQRSEKADSTKIEESNKWDAMSECDSLPQDERIEDRTDGVEEDFTLDSTTERLRSRLDKKKRKRSSDKLLDNINGYPKRRLREVSPSSSIEPFRLREDRTSASGDEMKKSKRAPRWRKRYLVAGLFSDYFKEDDEIMRIKRTESAAKSRLHYNPSDHPYGLLPPPYHCGKYLRCRKLPFLLPYDLWWQHTHSQLPGRDLVPSWNYRKIRTNIYNVKITTGACEPQPCNCTPLSNCGDDCINRLVLSECPASHKCQNQRIQRHDWAPGIEKFMTVDKGWGVRTKLSIKSGEFILEYVGEVVSDQEFKERMATIYGNDTHHYCLHLDGGLVIDGHRMGGDGRFVNHSCQPNCEMQKWSVNGQFRMALFALRDIENGEELTYDYNFSLFNPADGQVCKCGSEVCRGVIGGKSQRVRQLPVETKEIKHQPGRVGRPRKNQAKRTTNNSLKEVSTPQTSMSFLSSQVKLGSQQRSFILERHCFLLRNLLKAKKSRDRPSIILPNHQTLSQVVQETTFINGLKAPEKTRNIRTRRLAQVEDNPELNKTAKLASVLKNIWNLVIKAKDEANGVLSKHFMLLPSKRKVPEFYQRIANPIDFTTIEQNISNSTYNTVETFNADINRLFTNYLRFYGRTNEIGTAAIKLKKVYSEAKQKFLGLLPESAQEKPCYSSVANKNKNKADDDDDIIRCICGIPRDEGLMIQCEKCLVWQHSECVKADVSADSYHCEKCVARKVDYEIPLDEFTEHGHRYYMTLLRDDLQLRQGDTVYVLRDITIPGTNRKHTYDTIGKVNYTDLDIFRIERLWKDSRTGQRFAYGHHYLRPHETYHEPTRKFFTNEVMRVPLYEAVPVELIISHCWVMDLNTFCKGRPIGAPEKHIYICEYRVDKSARLFSKVSKSKTPICTKAFAFRRFETRLKISRTYTPHDIGSSMVKSRGRKPQEIDITREPVLSLIPVHVPAIKNLADQKARLNKILLKLLSKMPGKQVVNVSYLLEGSRRRKKQIENGKHG